MLKTILKSFFYSLLLCVLFVLCLYQFPTFGDFINEKTDSNISQDIIMQTDKIIDMLLSKVNDINSQIDNVAPKTAGGIEDRLENAEKVQ